MRYVHALLNDLYPARPSVRSDCLYLCLAQRSPRNIVLIPSFLVLLAPPLSSDLIDLADCKFECRLPFCSQAGRHITNVYSLRGLLCSAHPIIQCACRFRLGRCPASPKSHPLLSSMHACLLVTAPPPPRSPSTHPPTPHQGGWGSIEYGSVGGTATPGQVLGGRWKPLQYFFAAHLYTDLFVSCGADARCIVKNDGPLSGFNGTLHLQLLNVATAGTAVLLDAPIALAAGAGAATWLCAGGGGSPLNSTCPSWAAVLAAAGCSPSACLLLTSLSGSAGTAARSTGTGGGGGPAAVYSSFELLDTPAALMPALPRAVVTFTIGVPQPDGSVPITVTSDAVALFVGLTTAAHGRFSRNYFIALKGDTALDYLPFGVLDEATLRATTRIEHVMSYF